MIVFMIIYKSFRSRLFTCCLQQDFTRYQNDVQIEQTNKKRM
jgi:hypothetical protein